ncbi:hypothetical protein J4E89_000071 [Alternaria sp. Ai002NY15]|nr:hypothetical protein J4E89_000071 [Alternaria sp. Ai002NY15]
MYMLPRPFHPRYEPPEHLLNVFKQWENSSIRKKFLDTLSEKWTEEYPAGNINKIICFGLGELYTEVNEEGPAWLLDESSGLDKYLTVLAFEIASLLEVKLGTKVPMIFDDWSYDKQDKHRIKEFATERNTPISFMSNCEALLQVDKNTLVLAPSRARYNIRELIVDITRDEGGPAGFLCQTIVPITSTKHEVAWSKGEKDPPTMLLASMAKDYNMDKVCEISRWGVTMYLKRHAIKDPPPEGWGGWMLPKYFK